MNVHELLNKIQRELKAPKGQKNEFGGYRYRSCEDIVEAVKPLLGEGYLRIYDEIVFIGERYYVKATAEIFLDSVGISAFGYARETEKKKGMDEAQITGAASSYARKYALNGLFAIDDTKDPDSTNKHGKDNKPADKSPIERIQDKLDTFKSVDELNVWEETARPSIDKLSAQDQGKANRLIAQYVEMLIEQEKKAAEDALK